MKKVKLAIVTTHAIQYNAPLFELLSRSGKIEVKVFYTWGDADLEKKYDPGFGKNIQWDLPLMNGYPYVFVKNISSSPGSHHFSGIDNPTLNREIENWGASAVLVYGWAFKSHLKCMRYFKNRIPVLFRGDSNLLDEQPGLKQLTRRIILSWVYRFIDTALYVGEKNRLYFLKHGLKEKQLVFAPHCIDNTRFSKNESNTQEALNIRKELGIPNDSLVFLFAGKFEQKKDPLILISAFTAAGLVNSFLLLVGNGELEGEIKKLVADHPYILLLPFQNQLRMPAIYQVADIFVLPSQGPGETWGLAINEAMAAGKPVVASSACGATTDLVAEGTTGYRFSAKDVEDLKLKLRHCENNKQQLDKMGSAAKKIISNWNFESNLYAIESALNIHEA